MTATGDYVIGTIDITEIAETSRTNNNNETIPQWRIDCKPPWHSQYPLKLWLDQDRYEKPSIGTVRVKLRVGKLVKDDYSGEMPWMWKYYPETIPYDGEDIAATSSQPSQKAQGATQQGPQAQPVNWDRRAIEIKWGQAVNLAAGAIPRLSQKELEADETNSIRNYDESVRILAVHFFPLLIEWEKEAVDGMMEKFKGIDFAKLNEEGQKEQELQNAEAPDGGFAEPPEAPEDIQSYEDFRKAMVAANITHTVASKFFRTRDGESLIDAIESWMSIDGSLWHEAFAELQGSV